MNTRKRDERFSMNYKIIGIIACILGSYIFGIQRPITTICDKLSLLKFINSVIKNEIAGKIESRHIPYFKYIIFYNFNNPDQPQCSLSAPFRYNPQMLGSKADENNISIFEGLFEEFSNLTPSEVSEHIANIRINDPATELKVANIIHGIRPGIIESDPDKGFTARYHDESIKTEENNSSKGNQNVL